MGARGRRAALTLAGVAVFVAAAAAGACAMSDGDPAAPPRILMSLDRNIWYRLGLSRFTYARAVSRAGGHPVHLDYDDAGFPEIDRERVAALFADADGLLLSGGGDVDPALYGADPALGREVEPARDRFELALLAEARRRGLPILAVCRGAQLLNVELGGTLRDLRSVDELERRHRSLRRHPVRIAAASRLARILGTERLAGVNTIHGQAVGAPGRGVEPVAWADDGVVEAIEVAADDGVWITGVQWHPELTLRDVHQRRLLAAFVAEAAEHRRHRLMRMGR